MTTIATPTKLKSGAWGARVQGTVRKGDAVTITTKAGKSWQATVTQVVWTGNGVSIVATGSADRSGSSRDAGGRGRCVKCGDPIDPRYRVCLECRDGGARARGGASYYDQNGNFVLGEDD